MNVLVATSLSQGTRDDDYHWCVEGELVTIQEPCACDSVHPESGCGCSRGFAGLSSQRATTTARIAEIPGFTVGDYVAALASGLSAQGWDPADAEGLARDQLALIAGWPTDAILERSYDRISIRRRPPAPGLDGPGHR